MPIPLQDSWQYVERLLGDAGTPHLDWSNSCVFHLTPGMGAVVQAAPQYPLSTTAAFHAARVTAETVYTGDYDSG